MMLLLWQLVAVSISTVLVCTAQRAWFTYLRVPGPWIAKFTDLWYLFQICCGDFEVVNQRLHAKYGPVVQYGPNRFSISDPSTAIVVLGPGSKFAKSSWYKTWTSPGSWSIFADTSIKRHAQNRRLFQNAYSMSSLVNYEPYVNHCARLLRQRLGEIAHNGSVVDLRHWLQCYAFDVIGVVTYGKRFGFLDKGQDIGGVMRALEQHLLYATTIGVYHWLHPILYPIANFLEGGSGSGRAYILKFTETRIMEARKSHGRATSCTSGVDGVDMFESPLTEPFLAKFLTKYEQQPERFTRQHVLVGCAANMVAGSDTTAISLAAVFYYLLKNPRCYEQLQKEVQLHKAQKTAEEDLSFDETQKMPYLQAVIKEALRMHPATGLPLERVVPEGGMTICGRYFKAGAIVGINCWVQHRNCTIFGEDADSFRPERWITEDLERLSLMNRTWMPFGLGSRNCLGRHIAILEMTTLIPQLVHDFEFEMGEATGNGATWSTSAFWFVKPTKFLVRARRI